MLAQQEFGLMPAKTFDEYKRIWLETDVILFTVTAIVSCLHTVFEFLAFKNEISFWSGKEDVEGLSVKTLYVNIVMQMVITLYLFDNETSMMVFVPQALGIGVSVWKLFQASEVEKRESFSYIRLVDKKSYAQS